MNSSETSRPYRSTVRREQARRTRVSVLDAAREEFLAGGYAATSMRAVAQRAGVSVPTVEQLFGTKRALLAAVVDVTTAGDDEPVAMLDRPDTRAAAAQADLATFLAAVTDLVATVAARVSGVHAVVDAAAAGDPAIAELAAEIDRRRRVIAAWIVDGVAARAPVRVERDEAVDTAAVLLDPVVHRRLARSGTPYAAWLADALTRLLVE